MASLAESTRLRNLRRLVIVIGIVIIACSLAALVYAFWPVEAVQEQAPLIPTVFAPP